MWGRRASLIGFAGGMIASLLCVVLSLRAVSRRSPRALLGAHSIEQPAGVDPTALAAQRADRRAPWRGGGGARWRSDSSGPRRRPARSSAPSAALLTAFLFMLSSLAALARRHARSTATVTWAMSRLGFRGAAFRPARSVLSAALVASAAFIIVSVDAFRRGGGELTQDQASGTGGYVLLAQSEVPIVHDPDTPAGREALVVQSPEFARAGFTRFRSRPGEDVSCLNLYRPGNPTIVAPEALVPRRAPLHLRGLARRDRAGARQSLAAAAPSILGWHRPGDRRRHLAAVRAARGGGRHDDHRHRGRRRR